MFVINSGFSVDVWLTEYDSESRKPELQTHHLRSCRTSCQHAAEGDYEQASQPCSDVRHQRQCGRDGVSSWSDWRKHSEMCCLHAELAQAISRGVDSSGALEDPQEVVKQIAKKESKLVSASSVSRLTELRFQDASLSSPEK